MILPDFYKKIPTWDNGTWGYTEIHSLEEYRAFLKSHFKVPGEYDYDESSLLFNEQARNFEKQGYYNADPPFSKNYIKYWDFEKEKSINGCLFINKDKSWFLPRDYYFWINFLKIYNKLLKKFEFPSVWDVQLHMALYEELAEAHYLHASITKKRQIASSYFHMAKCINRVWFDEGAIIKIGASLKDYINLAGSWKFLDEYRSHLNRHTAWYRPLNPGKPLDWMQKIEETVNGRTTDIGTKASMTGMSFEQTATKGVGGPCSIFFYEEAGVAPTMDKTFEFIRPAMQAGDFTTGLFIAAGSVGELKDCDPLKEMTMNPLANDIYPVETDLIDETGVKGLSGLFIPEHWAMPPYIDDYGNSMVEEALEALNAKIEGWRDKLNPTLFQYRVSQHPRNIKEAFAYRDQSLFPTNLIHDNERRIKDKDYPFYMVDLKEDANGAIVVKKTTKPPIDTFPIKLNQEDKSGSIQIWEAPSKNPKFGEYLASIDPVGEGKTTTSESLCSIYVYRTATKVQRTTSQGVENFIEGDKVVAAWCGRYDDINETHKRLRLIIEYYNAYTLVENNISLFIRYMIGLHKQKYLVPKSDMIFLKEAKSNMSVYQDYGWKNTGTLFKEHMLNYLIEFLKEVIYHETDEDGVITKRVYGISRIPDQMAMTEMLAYRDGVNVDRLVSLTALIAFAKLRESNVTKEVRIEDTTSRNLDNPQNFSKLNSTGFRNIGRNRSGMGNSKSRSAFKRIK